jgi:hypothetical protein
MSKKDKGNQKVSASDTAAKKPKSSKQAKLARKAKKEAKANKGSLV